MRADADHSQMLKRVDSLSDRLNQIDPPFPSWTAAMREIESFVDELDRHEKEESDQIAANLVGQYLRQLIALFLDSGTGP